MTQLSHIRIGTRKSQLALAQAELVRAQLATAFPGLAVAIVPLITSGDKNADRTLADIGGKALFTKELEEALLSDKVDIAVHSLKDMESVLPEGLAIAAVLEREDPHDALIAKDASSLAGLAIGARIGTSSPRRAAQLKIMRPDIQIVPMRGNVPTRIAKVRKGEVDATLLALAGLRRIGLQKEACEIMDTRHFLPAAGQGTIAIECVSGSKSEVMLQPLNHAVTMHATIAERSLLATLGGSCRTPIAAYARMQGTSLRLDTMLFTPDGAFHVKAMRIGAPEDAQKMGEDAAKELLAQGGKRCLA